MVSECFARLQVCLPDGSQDAYSVDENKSVNVQEYQVYDFGGGTGGVITIMRWLNGRETTTRSQQGFLCRVMLTQRRAYFFCVLRPNKRPDGARYVYRTVKDIRFPLSVRNEKAAMQRLLALVKDIVAGYPTSLGVDRAALKVRGGRARGGGGGVARLRFGYVRQLSSGRSMALSLERLLVANQGYETVVYIQCVARLGGWPCGRKYV